ncbi:MAG: rhomboid family intramembrane serine protease [Phaeodactylibacter sp.]|nr:rhomboid family intramembrane serine protease [Phaeodactylibacter sp.]MCB9276313.1 rhomboid family intramembrane serine protease [Lewinellaceae bacterium]
MTITQKFRESLLAAFYFVAVLWLIQLFQAVTGIGLGDYGILPREAAGLRGILFAPLLHSGWPHLLANTPPLFFLTIILFFFYRRIAARSFIMIYLLTGLAMWLFARDEISSTGVSRTAVHIGASGVIYGLVAFIFWTGIFRRNLKSIILALIVLFYYGSMFMGILPIQEDPNISWDGHLLGALAGIFTAFWYKNNRENDETKTTYSWEEEPEQEKRPFLSPDTFEKTREERRREQEKRGNDWFSTGTW